MMRLVMCCRLLEGKLQSTRHHQGEAAFSHKFGRGAAHRELLGAQSSNGNW